MSNPTSAPHHLAFAIDRHYLPWCATAICSYLQLHPGAGAHIHILHDGRLPSAEAARLGAMVARGGGRAHLHTVEDPRLDALPPVDRFGRVVWMRALLPEILPDQDRVLYLDADTLVTAPLHDLWASDLAGAAIAAVPNVVEPSMVGHVRTLGIEDPRLFFNSGVLLMDLDEMRARSSFDVIVAAGEAYRDRLVWPDQDVLNVAFAGAWMPLHPRWNAQNSLWGWTDWAISALGDDAVREAVSSPAIVHFEGPSLNKPWHYLCRHPWRDRYRQVLGSTPWGSMASIDRTAATVAIARLPERLRIPVFARLERWRARPS